MYEAAFANAIFIGVISAAVKGNRERWSPVDGVAGAVNYSSGVEADPTLEERVRLLSIHAPLPAAPCHETCDTQKRSSRKRGPSPTPTK